MGKILIKEILTPLASYGNMPYDRQDNNYYPMAITERLETRIPKEQKDIIRQAAALTGRSLTDFVVSTAYESALKTIQDHQNWKLNNKQGTAFVEALLASAEPSGRLKQAAKRYQQTNLSD